MTLTATHQRETVVLTTSLPAAMMNSAVHSRVKKSTQKSEPLSEFRDTVW